MNVPALHTVAALIVSLLLAGSVVASVVTPVSMAPIDVGSGEVVDSEPLIIDSQQLTYSGTHITGGSVVVNNTDDSNMFGNITVALGAANGSVVAEQTETNVEFASNSTTTVTVSFSSQIQSKAFFRFNVAVRRA